jgi:hypothetical protein
MYITRKKERFGGYKNNVACSLYIRNTAVQLLKHFNNDIHYTNTNNIIRTENNAILQFIEYEYNEIIKLKNQSIDKPRKNQSRKNQLFIDKRKMYNNVNYFRHQSIGIRTMRNMYFHPDNLDTNVSNSIHLFNEMPFLKKTHKIEYDIIMNYKSSYMNRLHY